MTRIDLERKLAALLDDSERRTDTSGVAFALAQPSTGWTWVYGDSHAPYFIASITKLYTTALVMDLVNRGHIGLDLPIVSYLPRDVVAGLNVQDGVDRSEEITVRHLLSHTSGIADYFEQKRTDGTTTFGRALVADQGWTFEQAVEIAKHEMRPRFAPGAPGKASYSDTNYQLLGAIVGSVTGMTFEAALAERVISPLELSRTYLFTAETLDRYDQVATMLWGTEPVRIPLVMASVGADGGIVSTADESMRFLQAFMTGELFPSHYLADMQREWRRIFFPLQYGVGVMRFALPRVMTGFRSAPAMIGHSGASGAVAFYAPKIDLYVTGTVNQVKKRSLVYQLMTRVVMLVARDSDR